MLSGVCFQIPETQKRVKSNFPGALVRHVMKIWLLFCHIVSALSNVPGVCEYFALWEGREGSYPYVYIEEVWYQHLFNSVWFASPSEYLTNNSFFFLITERRFVTTRYPSCLEQAPTWTGRQYFIVPRYIFQYTLIISNHYVYTKKYYNPVWSFINHFCFKPVAICFKMLVGAPACPNRFA